MLLFLKIMFTVFIAEMGDKTQLMLVAMTSKFKIRDIIAGTLCAIMVLNGIAVLAGAFVGNLIPAYLIKLLAGAAFIFFAITSLKKEEEEDEKMGRSAIKFAPLAVFSTFFIAELGDKTQLAAITFGANEGIGVALIVWLACSIGLFAADIIGMMIGYFLKSSAPEGVINKIAFIVFLVFGIVTLREGILMMIR